jgi:PKD repeat protein
VRKREETVKKALSRILLSITMVLFCLVAPNVSALQPLPPCVFYGYVYVGGKLAPDGLKVTAVIGGAVLNWTTETGSGTYGWAAKGSSDFWIPSNDPETPGKDGGAAGDWVEFYIEGVRNVQTAFFESMGVKRFDLSVTEIPTQPKSPAVEWYKTYGGIGNEEVYGSRSLIETSDGGYALVGWTYSYGSGGRDGWLIKTDAYGNIQWNKTYGKAADDDFSTVIQTDDGGYAFAGGSWNQDRGAFDLFVVKTDSNGNMQWNLTYIPDSSGGSLDWGAAWTMIKTSDGGYIISGSIRHHPSHPTGDWDAWVVKVNATGQVQWDKPYFSGQDDGGGGIIQTADGGYAFVGATQSWGGYGGRIWLVKIDGSGNQQWVKTYGGGGGPTDNAYSIVQMSDGGYMIAGYTCASGAGSSDFCLIKTDSLGNQIWLKTYGGVNDDQAHSMVQTSDGGYVLAGYTKSFGVGGSDVWLVKTDPSGNQQWNEIFGGANDDRAASAIQPSDGGYAVAGCTNSFGAGSYDFLLIKLASPSPQASPPVANFNWSPPLPITGESITFDASSSTPGWNGTNTMPIVLYAWDFGDGVNATGQTVAHSYTYIGNYTIALNVTDGQGLWDVEQKQIRVGQPHSPEAAFAATPMTVHPGEAVKFNASTSLPGWNGTDIAPITGYLWDFGDGNTTSAVDPLIVHVYPSPGEFTVTLTVTDSDGLNSSSSTIILVVMPTFISISTSSPSTFVGFAVDINGTLSDFYGNGLKNQTVVLYYTFSGVDIWFPIASGITDNLGQYYVQWIPTATSCFTIKAEWDGNTTYSGTSNTATLSSLGYNHQYVFSVESNSTIAWLAFNTTDWSLSFTATGPDGTEGYTKITVAKSLAANPANIAVYLDGNQTEYSITSTDDSWLLTFNYTHSTHKIIVDLNTNAIPEFLSLMLTSILMILTLLAVVVYRRKQSTAYRRLATQYLSLP